MAETAHNPAGVVAPAGASAPTPHGHAHAHHDPDLKHHFEDLGQQHDASNLGMWAFLATEVMFFGGVIGSYLVYRFSSPDVWGAASSHLNVKLATLNTVVLLTSSLTMALAVHAGEVGVRRDQVRYLIATMVLGTLFLVFKGYEYSEEYHDSLIPGPNFSTAKLHIPTVEAAEDPGALSAEERAEVGVTAETASVLTVTPPQFARQRAQMFFVFYFTMTGLHAVHMVVGLVMLAIILSMARRGRFTARYSNPLEVAGLYWHFIDIVWVFLYPLLYLVALHK